MSYLEQLFLWWMFYAFVGWVWETLLALALRHRLVDRGVLNGPICPIYGFGGISVILLLHDVENPFALFLSSGVIACVIEYLTSYAIERLFSVRLWDYTDKPFNIHGRVYLNGFIAFGAGSTLVMLFVQPWLSAMTATFASFELHLVAGILAVLLLVDLALNAAGLYTLHSRLAMLNSELNRHRAARIDAVNERIAEEHERLSQFNEHIHETLNWQQRRLIDAFPQMMSTRDGRILDEIRHALEERRRHRCP